MAPAFPISRFFVAFMLAAACSAAAPAEQTATISIDAGTRLQTMRGWEVTIDLSDPKDVEKLDRASGQVFDKAAYDLGINRVRLEVRSGAENNKARAWERFIAREIDYPVWRPLRYPTINDNDDPKVINWAGFDFAELDYMYEQQVEPMRKRLALRGEKLFINLCYVAFTKQIAKGEYVHSDPEEYAEFVLATYLHLKEKYGIVPDSWEVILEPDLVPEWTPQFIGKAIVASAKRLEENGFKPSFVVPSVTNTANGPRFIDGVARVKGAMKHVAELSYHRYRKATPENVRAIAERGKKYGKPTSMLELWFGRANSRVLFQDLTIGNVSAFQGRTLFGNFDIGQTETGPPRVTMRKEVVENRQVTKYVHMGAVRLGASSDRPQLAVPVAFENPDGSMVAAVRVSQPALIRVKGLEPGRYQLSYAAGTFAEERPDIVIAPGNETAEFEMPAPGVVTFAAVAPSKP